MSKNLGVVPGFRWNSQTKISERNHVEALAVVVKQMVSFAELHMERTSRRVIFTSLSSLCIFEGTELIFQKLSRSSPMSIRFGVDLCWGWRRERENKAYLKGYRKLRKLVWAELISGTIFLSTQKAENNDLRKAGIGRKLCWWRSPHLLLFSSKGSCTCPDDSDPAEAHFHTRGTSWYLRLH